MTEIVLRKCSCGLLRRFSSKYNLSYGFSHENESHRMLLTAPCCVCGGTNALAAVVHNSDRNNKALGACIAFRRLYHAWKKRAPINPKYLTNPTATDLMYLPSGGEDALPEPEWVEMPCETA